MIYLVTILSNNWRDNSNNFYLIIIFLKLVNIKKQNKKLSSIFNFQNEQRQFMDLINLLLTLIFSFHVFSCLWHGIAILEINLFQGESTWLHTSGLIEEENIFVRYNTCFYFSIVTTTSVGYGDISGSNTMERGFLNGMLIISGVLYAYTINSIGEIMQSIKDPKKRMI